MMSITFGRSQREGANKLAEAWHFQRRGNSKYSSHTYCTRGRLRSSGAQATIMRGRIMRQLPGLVLMMKRDRVPVVSPFGGRDCVRGKCAGTQNLWPLPKRKWWSMVDGRNTEEEGPSLGDSCSSIKPVTGTPSLNETTCSLNCSSYSCNNCATWSPRWCFHGHIYHRNAFPENRSMPQ